MGLSSQSSTFKTIHSYPCCFKGLIRFTSPRLARCMTAGLVTPWMLSCNTFLRRLVPPLPPFVWPNMANKQMKLQIDRRKEKKKDAQERKRGVWKRQLWRSGKDCTLRRRTKGSVKVWSSWRWRELESVPCFRGECKSILELGSLLWRESCYLASSPRVNPTLVTTHLSTIWKLHNGSHLDGLPLSCGQLSHW